MSLPDAWIDRIFGQLIKLYGREFRDRYADVDPAQLRGQWAVTLGGFRDQPERIAAALKACESRDRPPNLPEFIRLCREAHPTARPRLDAPRPDPAVVREQVRRVSAAVEIIAGPKADPLRWARHPRSVHAVRLLIRGAARNAKLRSILAAHIADKGAACADPAAAALLASAALPDAVAEGDSQ